MRYNSVTGVLEYYYKKLMFFSYINPLFTSNRGPMISHIHNQIATTTQFSVLNCHIIDKQSETDDVQITLSKILQIDASVILKRPKRFSLVEVIRGIDMFD